MKEAPLNLPFVTPEMLETIFSEETVRNAREQMQSYQRLMAYYRCAMMEIETKLNVLNEEFSLRHDRNPISDVKSRLKHPESIREKLLDEYEKGTLENKDKMLQYNVSYIEVCAIDRMIQIIRMEKETLERFKEQAGK